LPPRPNLASHKAGGDVIVPKTIDGKPVAGIGKGAFGDCAGLASVTIPECVTRMGWNAFGVTNLESETRADIEKRFGSDAL
jgi:hypothetical protein